MVMVDRAKLINFLNEYFNDDEIVMLCAVEFPPVFNDFGSGQRKSQKVLDLVTYCERHGEVEALPADVIVPPITTLPAMLPAS